MPLVTNQNYNIAVEPNRSLLQGIIRQALVQGIVTTTWNIKSGGQSKVIYKGTEQQVVAIARNAQQDGFEYSITGGHIWTIEITFPLDVIVNDWANEPDPVTAWELSNTPVEQNILELKDRYLIGSLAADTKKNIEKNLKNPNLNIAPCPPVDMNQFINATVAQNLKFAGVEGRLQFVPTLKRTIVVSNKYKPSWAAVTNGKVMTTATLKSRYGTAAANGNNPLSALPDFLSDVLPVSLPLYFTPKGTTNIQTTDQIGFLTQNQIGSDGIVTFVGWLEYPPEYQTLSLNKIQVSQQWVFNRWSAGAWGVYDSYPVVSGPDPIIAFT